MIHYESKPPYINRLSRSNHSGPAAKAAPRSLPYYREVRGISEVAYVLPYVIAVEVPRYEKPERGLLFDQQADLCFRGWWLWSQGVSVMLPGPKPSPTR